MHHTAVSFESGDYSNQSSRGILINASDLLWQNLVFKNMSTFVFREAHRVVMRHIDVESSPRAFRVERNSTHIRFDDVMVDRTYPDYIYRSDMKEKETPAHELHSSSILVEGRHITVEKSTFRRSFSRLDCISKYTCD